MNPILEWLSGGDLRSDGIANEVAEVVLKNPSLLDDVIAGIDESDDVIRARTADALEKIARVKPELLVSHLPKLTQIAVWETVPMVKMHLAMIMGHLAIYQEHLNELNECLLTLLKDESVFTRSWVIVSLCILARKYPKLQPQIVAAIAPLSKDDSIAIRTKVRKALEILTNENIRFPKGWIKSEHLKEL
jgi:hypothetical protein